MKNLNFYPKVLIIGASFDDCTGAGVTLTNLFKDWPSDKLAVADYRVCEDGRLLCRPCSATYSFKQSITAYAAPKAEKQGCSKRSLLRQSVSSWYRLLGIGDIRSPMSCNESFLNFFDNFNPDIVFTPLGSIASMHFFRELMQKRQFKPVIHIWDDFLPRLNNRLFPAVWKAYADYLFKNILSRADMLCLSIGDKMTKEYARRYGREFFPFHNPVDIDEWDSVPQTDTRNFTVSYFGKINANTEESLLDLCKAVDILNQQGYCVGFAMHSGKINPHFSEKVSAFRHSHVCEKIGREGIIHAFKSSSILFYPVSFDSQSIEYQKLSIHTKMTEYIASGVPILLYAPKNIAVSEYLEKYNAAEICNQGVNNLVAAIQNMMNNASNMHSKVNNAYLLAKNEHNAPVVRERFLQTICHRESRMLSKNIDSDSL